MGTRAILALVSIFVALSTAQDYRLPDTVIPTRYDLTFHIKPETDTFSGISTITFNTTDKTDVLKVHATPGKIDITSVIYDAQKCIVNSTDDVTEIVTIICPDNFGADKNLVSILYEGTYSEDARGIFKSSYEENGVQKTAVATQLEATFARRVFPCLDEPRFKAIFDITVVHPKDYTVVSNSVPLEEYDTADGKLSHFNITPLMSTYLVAFVVSQFNTVRSEGTDAFSIHTRPGVKDLTSTALQYGLPLMYKMGNWTNLNYFQMGNAKMEQVALQTLPIEAMENWGMITYEEMDQIDEGNYTTVDQKQRIVTTMAHELAHQWFGDLVTMDWWSDTWLNEGFATYFEYHLAALLEDFDFDLERQFVSKILHSVLQKDSLLSQPLSNEDDEIETPDKIQDKFDDISYSKGACIIRMIKGILGEKNFQKAIQQYLSENKNQNTNPKDLLKIIQSIYQSKEHPIDVTMVPYIYQVGYPLVSVTKAANNTVTITQEMFKIVENGVNATWYVPISYTTSDEKKFDVTIKEWLEPDKSLDVKLKDGDGWILLNMQQSGYFRVNYDSSLWDKLTAQLKGNNKDDIDVLNRAQLIDDIFNIARIGKVSYEKVFQLAEYLKNETEYYPWVAYFEGISFILDHILDQETTKLIQTLTLEWLKKAFPNDNSTDNSPIGTLKNLLINEWKCKFGDSDCMDYTAAAYNNFKNTSSFSDYNERYLILCNSIRSSHQPFDDLVFVFKEYENIDSAYARRVYLDSLGCIQDGNVLDMYLGELIYENRTLKKQDAPTMIKAVINGGYKGVDRVLQLLYHWTIFLHDEYKGFFTISDLLNLLANKINTEEHAALLYGIMNYNSSYVDKDACYIANETIRANMFWRRTYEKEIMSVLKKMNGGDGNRGHTVYYSVFMTVIISILSIFVL